MLRIRQFADNARGTVAIEFAAVATIFLTLLVFLLIIGLAFFLKQSLDVATMNAARQVLTGQAQRGNIDQSKFKQILCSKLPSFMACADVIVNLYIVPDGKTQSGYYNFVNSDLSGLKLPNSSGAFNLGARGNYQYLQVVYPFTYFPKFLQPIIGSNYKPNGKSAYALISTAAFRNEQF